MAGVYKLSATQQAEAIKMIRVGEKNQAEIAELFNVDRSTISPLVKEAREKELVKSGRQIVTLQRPRISVRYCLREISFAD